MSGPAIARRSPELAARYPRHATAVPKPDDQFRAHRHGAALADYQTHEMGPGPPPTQGHEVDQDDRTAAVRGGELGFENQRIAPVAAPETRVRVRSCGSWRDSPMAIVRVAQQRGKTRPRVEAGPAEPVDGAVLGDERGRLAVTDERVILDATRHECSSLEIVDDLDVARPMNEMGARKLKPCRSPSDRWERVSGAIQVVRRSGPAPIPPRLKSKQVAYSQCPSTLLLLTLESNRKHRQDSIVFGSALRSDHNVLKSSQEAPHSTIDLAPWSPNFVTSETTSSST